MHNIQMLKLINGPVYMFQCNGEIPPQLNLTTETESE